MVQEEDEEALEEIGIGDAVGPLAHVEPAPPSPAPGGVRNQSMRLLRQLSSSIGMGTVGGPENEASPSPRFPEGLG